MSKVSLVIINDDAEPYLPRLFESIGSGSSVHDLEIVFIDNCSSDNSILRARQAGAQKIYRFDQKVIHRGELFSRGADLSSAEHIIFAHSDVYFASDFFQNLLLRFSENKRYDVINFMQYYVDGSFFGDNQVAINSVNSIYYHQLFGLYPDEYRSCVACSEGCFMVHHNFLNKFSFGLDYYDSFFEFNLFFNAEYVEKVGSCIFSHYFIELHEKVKTQSKDIALLARDRSALLAAIYRVEASQEILTQKEKCISQMTEERLSIANNLQLTHIDDISKKNEEIAALHNSFSWKLTRPVRGLYDLLQRCPLAAILRHNK